MYFSVTEFYSIGQFFFDVDLGLTWLVAQIPWTVRTSFSYANG